MTYQQGQLAKYGSCQVRISSVNMRGIAAPYYRFSCIDYGHEHPKEWGTLTSHSLLSPVREEKYQCSECEREIPDELQIKCYDCESSPDYYVPDYDDAEWLGYIDAQR